MQFLGLYSGGPVDQQQVMVEAEDREAASSLARERTPGWTLNEWSVVKR
jgi:hypothetical protein